MSSLSSRRLVAAALASWLVAALLVLTPAPASAEVPSRIAGSDRFATAAALSQSRFSAGVPVAFVVTGVDFPDALAAGAAAGARGGPVLLTARDEVPEVTEAELDRLDPEEIVVVGGTSSVSTAVEAALASSTGAPVRRVQGTDRFSTAAAVSADAFDAAPTVFVANGLRFPDALAGVPAAVRAGAPLLLVGHHGVPSSTASEIDRLGATEVVLLGGAGTIDEAVRAELASLAGSATRTAGSDRYGTSAAVSARSFPSGAGTAFLATGQSYADALSAGPVAALSGAPVLLVGPNCVPPAVLDELDRLGDPQLVLIGGDRAVGPGIEDRTRCPSAQNLAGSPSVSPSAQPAWDDDGPDPHVARFGSTYYAYTTGTTWGNNLGVLVSDRPDGGWHTTTGQPYGSTALAGVPSWQVPDTQWAPGVFRYAGRYVLFYAAQARATGEWCLSVAVAAAPTGPFHDQTEASGPIVCLDHLGGVIDPHPFLAADGTPWLHFKNNDGFGSDAVSKVFAVRLDAATGSRPAGPLHEVLVKDTERYPWQSTVDNPQMILRGGVHYLFHTGGDYVGNDTYATGYAVCAGPIGPCTTASQPILSSYGDVAGPGGGTVVRGADGRWWMSYHAWPKGCSDYSCGERRLYVAPLDFG